MEGVRQIFHQNTAQENYTNTVSVIPPLGVVYDDAVGNSKTFTVPTNQQWFISYAQIRLISDASIGTRQLAFFVEDDQSRELIRIAAGATQILGENRTYNLLRGNIRETAFVSGNLNIPAPDNFWLGSSYTITFEDSNAVSAGDQLIIALQLERFVV